MDMNVVNRILHMDQDGHRAAEEAKLKEGFSNDYAAIADKDGLIGTTKDLFVQYMQKRWPDGQDEMYASEWAGRFQSGTEWHASDGEGQAVLKSLAPKNYPPKAEEGKIPDDRAKTEDKIKDLREAGDPADVVKYRQLWK